MPFDHDGHEDECRLVRSSVILNCERQRASKDGRSGRRGRRPSRVALRATPGRSCCRRLRAHRRTPVLPRPRLFELGGEAKQRGFVAEARGEHPVAALTLLTSLLDFHDTGIFTWNYLHTLGHDKDKRWQEYLDELAQKGLSRDR